ncbi:hypothetical protein DL95DRAFT_510692 [Leptodontidium sp. 2 PMI_412]|nr:hypothetical protein DL95DRAFT_510692 [Leptodontidium sp. 2 PMI_412]
MKGGGFVSRLAQLILLQNAEAAAEEFKTVQEVVESVGDEMAKPNLPDEIIADGVIPTAAQVVAVSEVVTAGTEIAATVGQASVVVSGVVTAVATGIFATLAAVLSHFLPPGPGGGGDDPDPPTTTKTTSSSTTGSPTMSPTSMVILMKENATAAQYKDLVLNVPDPASHVEISYEVVNFRVLIANVHDCDIKKLWENPIVEAMSLEGPLILDDEALGPERPL